MTERQTRDAVAVLAAVSGLDGIEQSIGADTLRAAILAREMIRDGDVADRETAYAVATVARRIVTEMPDADEPRFSAYDYADAVTNAATPVDVVRLAELSVDDLAASLTYLAENKRETYEDRPHAAEPPASLPVRRTGGTTT